MAPILDVQRRIFQGETGPMPNIVVNDREYLGEVLEFIILYSFDLPLV